jgi:hypothetical protein
MNDVIARLDQEIQGAANQLALARQDVARRTTLLGRFQSLPQTVQQTLQAAGAQVDQVQAQLVALSSAAALATAPAGSATSAEPAASGDTQLPESIDKLAHEVAAAAAAAGVQLQNAQAVAAHLAELLATAENELQSAQTAVAAAEDAQQQATERRKRADDFVKQLDQQLAEAEKSFGPVELSSYVYSPAFTLKVNRSPLFSQLPAEPLALRPGEMREVLVTIERRFGFTDAVDVSLKAPDGVTQIVAEPRRIESDRTEATLHINAALDAPPGEHSFEVILKLKFNGVELQDSIPLKIMVVQP